MSVTSVLAQNIALRYGIYCLLHSLVNQALLKKKEEKMETGKTCLGGYILHELHKNTMSEEL